LYALIFGVLENRGNFTFLSWVMTHCQNLFFCRFYHEPHFCLLVLFPETYVHLETFLFDLLYERVFFPPLALSERCRQVTSYGPQVMQPAQNVLITVLMKRTWVLSQSPCYFESVAKPLGGVPLHMLYLFAEEKNVSICYLLSEAQINRFWWHFYVFFLKRHLQSFADLWPTLMGFSIYI
jgi:hypothetical protein